MPCSRRPAGTVKVMGPPYGDELQPAGTGGNGYAPGRAGSGRARKAQRRVFRAVELWCVSRWGGPAGRCSAGGVRRCPAPVPRPVTARGKPAARTSRHLRPHGPGASSPAWRTKPPRSRAAVSSAGVRSVRSGSVEAGGSGMTEPVRRRGDGFGPAGTGAAGADRGRPRRPGRSARDHTRCRGKRLTVCTPPAVPRDRVGAKEGGLGPQDSAAGGGGTERAVRATGRSDRDTAPAPEWHELPHPPGQLPQGSPCGRARRCRPPPWRRPQGAPASDRCSSGPPPVAAAQYGPPGVSRTPRRTRRPRGRPGGCGRSRRSGGRGPRRCAGRWRRG